MDAKLAELKAFSDVHGERGAAIFAACHGTLFPCDGLAYAVLDRSLNLLKGFCLLLANGGYTCGAALLRMQLDNVLRLHGVVTTTDPHGIAGEVINGTPLRKLKDKDGQFMTDKRLVEVLSHSNTWVEHVYNLSSSYIHLSEQHFHHFMERSKKNQNGLRDFAIGDGDEYLGDAHKLELVAAFKVVTEGVLEVVKQWVAVRSAYGDEATLRARFHSAV
ncbi:MAG: hypothetical protein M0015_15020 [Betaproteobacteria bacterium]|nr:hypothetical protein [Betaproteobacteria bacterium]